MPSILTHHLFGEEFLKRYGGILTGNPSLRHAFFMGCQGPDPFFFAALGPRPKAYLRFGQLLHGTDVTRSLDRMFRFYRAVAGEEREILFGYLVGYLCHYALDRTAHPYVYAVQYAGCERLGLKRDKAHIHMRLETVIDSLLTGQYENPNQLMPRDKKVCLAVSRMFQDTASEVYGISLSKRCFWRAIRCMRLVERFLKSKRGIKRKFLVRVERLFCRYSMYDAMSHSKDLKGLEDPLNRRRGEWISPVDGTSHTETFEELFAAGLGQAAEAVRLLQSGAPACDVTNGAGFDGTKETVT